MYWISTTNYPPSSAGAPTSAGSWGGLIQVHASSGEYRPHYWGNTVIDARRRESCSLGGYESPWAPGGAIFIPGEIMTRREYWKPFFFTVKSFSEWASWWSQLPLGPNWHLQLLQLLFRYIEAGGIPSILFHYIPLLFSTTICWYPLPFWLPFYFMCARGASSRSG